MALKVILNETKYKLKKTDDEIWAISNTILDLILISNDIIKINHNVQDIVFSYAYEYIMGQIYDDLKIYLKEQTTINLHGYIAFRTKKYKDEIDKFLLKLLKNLLIKKRYDEFINDMKIYVMENTVSKEKIYLKYIDENFELYDENHRLITDEARLQYLYEFGAGEEIGTDFILHYLLKILPEKIFLTHINLNGTNNFLNTIELVFGERVIKQN